MSKERILLGVVAVFLCAGAGVCFSEPVIVVEPNDLNFSAVEGGANPDAQTLYISNGGTGKLQWEITEDCAWLSVEPLSGSTLFDETDEIEVSVNAAGLSIGEYSCELTITDPDAENSPQVVEVSLRIVAAFKLEVLPDKGFESSGFVGGPFMPGSKEYTLTNVSDELLYWGISWESDWLDFSDGFGSLDPNESVVITVYLTVEAEQLSEGDYYDTLKFTNLDTMVEQTRSVHLNVFDALWVPYAYPTIQAAIDAAVDGDVVIVADGVYTGSGNREISFLGKAITVKSENGAESCIIDCENLRRGFYFHSGEDANSVLGGFSIINGYANYGGGIMCDEAGPTIKNCIISDNVAYEAGGGLFSGEGSCTISNCVIEQNTAGTGGGFINIECGDYYVRGGGIYINGGEVTIKDSIISKNVAYFFYCEEYYTGSIHEYYGKGGGIGGGYHLDTAVIINNCIIEDNWAFVGGGLSHLDGTISNCIISGNESGDCGGGLSNCNGEINNCIITNNIAIDDEGLSGWGGGLDRCDGTISNCTIADNFADFSGGGLAACNGTISNCIISDNIASRDGGGLCSSGTINDCIITGNTANNGGGLYSGDGLIINCTITDNTAKENGGGVWSYYYDPTITNCIVWGNEPNEIDFRDCNPIVKYSDVRGGWEGEGNIDANPLFVNEEGYLDDGGTPADPNDDVWVEADYHLQWDSLCVDAGDPNYISEEGETDIDGEPRVMGGRVDMGADEVDNSRTITVALDGSGDYTTIQSAIDDANDCDMVIVADGTYTGDGNRDINFRGKSITVRSENGAGNCIIDCQGSVEEPHRGFIFDSGEGEESVLDGFTIQNGYAVDGGGGVFCYGSDPVITNCIIVDNTADYAGGVLCSNSNAEIRNCVISQNNAIGDPVAGGILCISSSNVEITGCTISANTNLWFEGAAVEISFFSSAVFRNCIVWSNICEYPLLVWPESELSVWYSDIEGSWEGIGNIDVEPDFVDQGWPGDYHLKWGSPCVDAGDPGFVAGEGEVDIDGEPRVMGTRVDMGADEVGEKQADFTRDGRIDVSDLSVLSGSWDTAEGEVNWYVLSDLFEDGVINISDLAAFVEDWMWVAEW